MLKKLFSVCLSVIMVMSFFATSAFAGEKVVQKETSINVDLPFESGTTREIVDGNYLIVVKDSVNNEMISLRAKNGSFAMSRDIEVYDIKSPKVYYGTMNIYAMGTAAGTVAGVTDYGAYIWDEPNHSDLEVDDRETKVTGNNTGHAEVRAKATFTADDGSDGVVRATLYVSRELL